MKDGSKLVVALWSMPRSRSTAFFRMMAERGDFRVLHEPFSNLAEFGRVEPAGREARTETELIQVIREIAADGPVFFKDTTDERYPALLEDAAFLGRDAIHTFLIRHPAETIASYHSLNPGVRLDQVGTRHLHEIHARVAELTGRPGVVVDAADLVADPAGTVRAYCSGIGIPFIPDSLTWEPGARTEWRATARWHADVSASTEITSRASRHRLDVAAHPTLSRYLDYHLPYYNELHERRLRPV